MRFERTKNSSRNFVFGVLEKIIIIVFPFITRTLIIYKLGSEYLGLTNIFTSILTLLSLSELGIGTAIPYCMYEHVAADNETITNKYLAYIKKIYKYVGLFILILGILISPFLNIIIKSDVPLDINIYLLYFIYLLNSAVSYLFFSYKETIYHAYQRVDIINKIRIVSAFVKYIIQIVVLIVFPNYYLFVIALLISTIVHTLIVGIKSKKDYPNLDGNAKLDKEIIDSVKIKTKYIFIISAFSTAVMSLDSILISSHLGISLLGIYSNYGYISGSVLSIALIAYHSITSAIGNALISENRENNYGLYKTLRFGVSWLSIWCAICLVCLYQPFINLWIGESYLLPFETMVLFVVFLYANINSQFYMVAYTNGAGMWEKLFKSRIIASITNMILSITLINFLGLNGILLASIISYLFIIWPTHIAISYKEIFKRNIKEGLINYLINIVCALVICVFSYLAISLIKDNGALSFVLKTLICFIVPNLIFVLLFRKNENFLNIKSHIINLFNRK